MRNINFIFIFLIILIIFIIFIFLIILIISSSSTMVVPGSEKSPRLSTPFFAHRLNTHGLLRVSLIFTTVGSLGINAPGRQLSLAPLGVATIVDDNGPTPVESHHVTL